MDAEHTKRKQGQQRGESCPSSLLQLATAASQRYWELYSVATVQGLPEAIADVLLRVMPRDHQLEKLGIYKAWWPDQPHQLWCIEHYQLDRDHSTRDYVPVGTAEWWHSNGVKWREESYDRMGRKHGLSRWWYPNGQLRAEAQYEAGQEVGYREWTMQGGLIKP